MYNLSDSYQSILVYYTASVELYFQEQLRQGKPVSHSLLLLFLGGKGTAYLNIEPFWRFSLSLVITINNLSFHEFKLILSF